MAFYDVGGLLVRRTPRRRGMPLEVWNGTEWQPYTDVDQVLRHGHRLTDARALSMLRESTHLTDKEGRAALRAPGKRS